MPSSGATQINPTLIKINKYPFWPLGQKKIVAKRTLKPCTPALNFIVNGNDCLRQRVQQQHVRGRPAANQIVSVTSCVLTE